MFKSSEGSGRLMIVKRKTILGNCLELENEQDNQNNDILPDVERNDICVLLSNRQFDALEYLARCH